MKDWGAKWNMVKFEKNERERQKKWEVAEAKKKRQREREQKAKEQADRKAEQARKKAEAKKGRKGIGRCASRPGTDSEISMSDISDAESIIPRATSSRLASQTLSYSQNDTDHESNTDDQPYEIRGSQQEDPSAELDDPYNVEPPIGLIAGRWPVPDWLIEEQPNQPSSTPIAHLFTERLVRKLGQKFKLATYTHDTVEDKCRAVMSIPWHDADHIDTTLEQKEIYHDLCDKGSDSRCRYQKWKADGRDPASFRRQFRWDLQGREVEWKRGFFAGMDTLYPYAWEELLLHWKRNLANPILMSRCMKLTTTNINESLHQKASLLLHKCKSHSTERCEFGAKHLVLSQNFGYVRSSMMNVFGWVSGHVHKGLSWKDRLSVESAMRKHKLGENTTAQHRQKRRTRRTGRGSGAYQPGGGD